MPGNRKTVRLKNYDYAQKGAYFVTVCVNDRKCMFGDVRNGEMVLNECGKMIDKWWRELNRKYNMIEIDEYKIMPNHLHGIINIVGKHEINGVGAPLVGALNNGNDMMIVKKRAGTRPAPTLGGIIGAFKSITTNEYIKNVKSNNWPMFNKRLWQRNFYEHVILNEHDLKRIREYIVNNPGGWEMDEYYAR